MHVVAIWAIRWGGWFGSFGGHGLEANSKNPRICRCHAFLLPDSIEICIGYEPFSTASVFAWAPDLGVELLSLRNLELNVRNGTGPPTSCPIARNPIRSSPVAGCFCCFSF